jgi:pseudouridine-5'-phosphate glycosidase
MNKPAEDTILEYLTLLKNFLDEENRLKAFPSKRKLQLCAVSYLAEKFEPGRIYTEGEVNGLLNQWHTFRDPETLRRELFQNHYLDRRRDGSAYWLEAPANTKQECQHHKEDISMNKYLDVAPEVAEALAAGKPVVALESTIISHGMPYPQNVETALAVEKLVRENGAVPATIAIIGGRLKAGLSPEEIEYFGKKGAAIAKASRRDLPVLIAKGQDGACTVTTTMMIAHMAGIGVFATGGIGGVHRGAETTMDISADLEELAQTPVMVICAGAKSILDLGLTLEYLETKGVPVIGYGTEELPAFYTRSSGFGVDYRLDTPAELAAAFRAQRDMGLKGGMLVTNPIPEEYAMERSVIDAAIDQAIAESREQGIHGKATTPFLLARVKDLTGGDSLASNIQLVFNNARLAAQTAVELAK